MEMVKKITAPADDDDGVYSSTDESPDKESADDKVLERAQNSTSTKAKASYPCRDDPWRTEWNRQMLAWSKDPKFVVTIPAYLGNLLSFPDRSEEGFNDNGNGRRWEAYQKAHPDRVYMLRQMAHQTLLTDNKPFNVPEAPKRKHKKFIVLDSDEMQKSGKIVINVGEMQKAEDERRTGPCGKPKQTLAQTHAADAKAADAKAADAEAAETKPAETKAAETKAAETKAAETKAAETKAAETKAAVAEPPAISKKTNAVNKKGKKVAKKSRFVFSKEAIVPHDQELALESATKNNVSEADHNGSEVPDLSPAESRRRDPKSSSSLRGVSRSRSVRSPSALNHAEPLPEKERPPNGEKQDAPIVIDDDEHMPFRGPARPQKIKRSASPFVIEDDDDDEKDFKYRHKKAKINQSPVQHGDGPVQFGNPYPVPSATPSGSFHMYGHSAFNSPYNHAAGYPVMPIPPHLPLHFGANMIPHDAAAANFARHERRIAELEKKASGSQKYAQADDESPLNKSKRIEKSSTSGRPASHKKDSGEKSARPSAFARNGGSSPVYKREESDSDGKM